MLGTHVSRPTYFFDFCYNSFGALGVESPRGGATMNLITLVIGAGVISLPAAVGGAGIIAGFGLVVFCGIVAIDSGRILCEAASLAEELGHGVQCFEDIGMAALGS